MAFISGTGDIVKAVTEWPARYFFAFAFVAGAPLVLIATPWAVRILGPDDVPLPYRLGLLLVTLGCLAVGTVKVITHRRERRNAYAAAVARGKSREAEMRNFTPTEYRVIAAFIDRESKIAEFGYVPGHGGSELADTAHALSLRGHLYLIKDSQSIWIRSLTYSIDDGVYAFFKRHPELLAKPSEARGE